MRGDLFGYFLNVGWLSRHQCFSNGAALRFALALWRHAVQVRRRFALPQIRFRARQSQSLLPVQRRRGQTLYRQGSQPWTIRRPQLLTFFSFPRCEPDTGATDLPAPAVLGLGTRKERPVH